MTGWSIRPLNQYNIELNKSIDDKFISFNVYRSHTKNVLTHRHPTRLIAYRWKFVIYSDYRWLKPLIISTTTQHLRERKRSGKRKKKTDQRINKAAQCMHSTWKYREIKRKNRKQEQLNWQPTILFAYCSLLITNNWQYIRMNRLIVSLFSIFYHLVNWVYTIVCCHLNEFICL